MVGYVCYCQERSENPRIKKTRSKRREEREEVLAKFAKKYRRVSQSSGKKENIKKEEV